MRFASRVSPFRRISLWWGLTIFPLTSHTNPPLTTIAQPHYQKGQLAIQKLFHSFNGDETDQEGLTLLECVR